MKKPIIILVVILLLAVAGFFGFRAMQKSPATQESQLDIPTKMENSGVVDKLKDAVAGADILKCESVIAQSDGTKTYMTYYYKMSDAGMKSRSEILIGKGTPAESTAYGVMDANKDAVVSYSWSKPQSQTPALKMDFNSKCFKDMMNNPAVKAQIEKSKTEQELATDANKSLAERSADLKANMEKVSGTTCQYTNGSVDLSVPSDIKFTDYCDMFGDISKVLEKLGQ